MTMMRCSYCGKDRDNLEGWHDCSAAQDAKARIDEKIESMTRIAEGQEDRTPMTSQQLHARANSRRDMANFLRANGQEINPDYGDEDAGDD